jgi:hypothetical protein
MQQLRPKVERALPASRSTVEAHLTRGQIHAAAFGAKPACSADDKLASWRSGSACSPRVTPANTSRAPARRENRTMALA